MNKLVEMYIKNKVCDFIRKSIYKIEITKKGKAGVEKFQELTDRLWDKAEEWIVEEKNRDIKWLPNIIEEITEETIHETIKSLRKELNIRKLAQEIFNVEKKEKVL